jgi:hypothetical protein
MKSTSKWRTVLIKASAFWSAVILTDLVIVYLYGPQIWSSAGYFFGSDVKTTFAVLMFVEGGILLALGLLWASGAMETWFQGGNLKTNPYFRNYDWKQRREQTEGQNIAGKILMIAGGPLLFASLIVLFA